jgi:hypothetical protein
MTVDNSQGNPLIDTWLGFIDTWLGFGGSDGRLATCRHFRTNPEGVRDWFHLFEGGGSKLRRLEVRAR